MNVHLIVTKREAQTQICVFRAQGKGAWTIKIFHTPSYQKNQSKGFD
jgi:hypothetical protein